MKRRMTINDMMHKAFWDTDIPEHPAQAWEQGYQLGANAVLDEIEKVLNSAHYLSDLSCKTQLYDNLVSLVEQLKK